VKIFSSNYNYISFENIFEALKYRKMERCSVTNKRFKIATLLIIFTIIVSSILPTTYAYASNSPMPSIIGTHAITMDMQTGEIIYSKGIDDKMYAASITKLMTALLLAEHTNKSDRLPYTQTSKIQPQYSLNHNIRSIAIGETMTSDDIMKALLLFSANDTAHMVADALGGSTEGFSEMMNEKAQELGLENSNFTTPVGLHDENHYTTAYDLALLTKAAYENPWVREAMGMTRETISTSGGTVAIIDNRNKLVGKDGCVGGKTGYTRAAGRCLAAVYERDGRTIIGVVLRSAFDAEDVSVFNDMKAIIDWSYSVERTESHAAETVVKTETVTYRPLMFFGPRKTFEIPVVMKDAHYYYENDVNKAEVSEDISLPELDVWKLSSDTKVGTITISERLNSSTYDLYTTIETKDIIASNKGLYIFVGIAVIAVVLILILLATVIAKKRRGRRRYRY
jgi:D-alanyl-D-alanine carboxypeptidase